MYDTNYNTNLRGGMVVITEGSVPKYQQIADDIQHKISIGKYQPGEKMPTENILTEEYQVSRVTIRKALDLLEEQNIIMRHQGKGTFVSTNKQPRTLSGVHSFSSIYKEMGKKPGAKVIRQILEVPTLEEQEYLQLAEGELLITIERIRYVDEEPVSVELSKLPSKKYHYLLDTDLNDNSMFDILKAHNITFYNQEKIIELTYADTQKAVYLNLQKGYPLILVSGLSYDSDGLPAHLFSQWIVGDRFKFVVR